MNRIYVDHARTLEILRRDSGVLPKLKPNWNTFVPKIGDYAKVGRVDYVFDGLDWVIAPVEVKEKVEEEESENKNIKR